MMSLFETFVEYGNRYNHSLFIEYIENAEKYKENPLSNEEIDILHNEQFKLIGKCRYIRNILDEYFRTKIEEIVNVIERKKNN